MSVPQNIAAQYGFYFLCRVKDRILLEDCCYFGEGWVEAIASVTALWGEFDVIYKGKGKAA
jgi:hypothetical protein